MCPAKGVGGGHARAEVSGWWPRGAAPLWVREGELGPVAPLGARTEGEPAANPVVRAACRGERGEEEGLLRARCDLTLAKIPTLSG